MKHFVTMILLFTGVRLGQQNKMSKDGDGLELSVKYEETNECRSGEIMQRGCKAMIGYYSSGTELLVCFKCLPQVAYRLLLSDPEQCLALRAPL